MTPPKFLALALLLCSLSAAAQAPPDSAAVLGRFTMGYPFPSPDGAHIAFQADFDGRWQLYTLSLDDGRTARLSVSDANDTHPAYAPDGRYLAFTSDASGNDDIYVLDLHTGERRPLAPHPGKDGHPKWSADGDWVVFNRTFDPDDPEGNEDAAILRVRADGTDLEVLSDSERIETFPSFSPDGQAVVFVEWFPDTAGTPARNGELVVVDLATGARTRLTDNDVFDAYPYWGASGRWIYFTPFTRDEDGRPNAAVHRISPETGVVEQVTPNDATPDVRAIPDADERVLCYNNVQGARVIIVAAPLRE